MELSLTSLVIAALVKAGIDGLTSDQIVNITGQTSNKLARQLMRKARFSLYEMGYRLAKDNERVDGGYVVYRAIELFEGESNAFIQREQEVTFYTIQKAA